MGTPDRRRPLLLALLAAALGWPGGARATVPDLYGLGARSLGMGGGGVAYVEDGTAATINPAGLSHLKQPTLALGFSAAIEHFHPVGPLWWDVNQDGVVDQNDPPLNYDVGVDNAYGAHFYLGRQIGHKFGIGLSGYMPVNRLLRFQTFEPSLPTWFMYQNRPQRYTLAAGFGGQIVKGLRIGASVDFVPRARLVVVMTASAAIKGNVDNQGNVQSIGGTMTVDVHQLSLDLVAGFAPIVGVQLDVGQWVPALKGLVIGGMYRGAVGLPIQVELDAQVNLSASDIGDLQPFVTAIVANAGLNLFDHYVPRTAAGSVALHRDKWGAYADVRWTDWRKLVLNIARLSYAHVHAPLFDFPDNAITDGNPVTATFRATLAARAGAEWQVADKQVGGRSKYWKWTMRAGAGWEPTPLVSQTSDSALLDADRVLVTLGAGVESFDPFKLVNAPYRIDVFGQYHQMLPWTLPRGTTEPKAGYLRQGDTIDVAGHIFVFGAQVSFDYQ